MQASHRRPRTPRAPRNRGQRRPRAPRQLSLFAGGVAVRPKRRRRDERGPTAMEKIKNVLEAHQRGDGCVQLSREEIGFRARVAPRHVARVMRDLAAAGWLRVAMAARRGAATVYAILRGVVRRSENRVTNAVTSCIPRTPLCINSPKESLSQHSSTQAPAEPVLVVVGAVREIREATGMEERAATKAAAKHGWKAVRSAVTMLKSAKNVVEPAAWLQACLNGEWWRNMRGRISAPVPAEELARRRDKAARIEAGMRAAEEERFTRMAAKASAPPPDPVRPIAAVVAAFKSVPTSDAQRNKVAFFRSMR